MSETTPEYPAAPQPSGTTDLTRDELNQIVADALTRDRAERDAQHDAEIKALRDQVSGLQSMLSSNVVTGIAEHAGGPGTEIAETWSQYEQTKARAAAEAALNAA